jgi:hypothetical protein
MDQANADIDRSQHVEARAPADALDQELGEGDAKGAGEPADEGHQQDGLLVARPVNARDDGEGRLIEQHGLAGTKPDPQRIEQRQRIDARPENQQDRRHQ